MKKHGVNIKCISFFIIIFVSMAAMIAMLLTSCSLGKYLDKYLNQEDSSSSGSPAESGSSTGSEAGAGKDTGDGSGEDNTGESGGDTSTGNNEEGKSSDAADAGNSGTNGSNYDDGKEGTTMTPEVDIMFNNSDAGFAFVYPHNNLTLASYSGWKEGYGGLYLDVDITALENMEGDLKDAALSEKESLEKGDFGQDEGFSFEPSRKVIDTGDVFVKEYMVFGKYEICDITFERSAVFYNNGYQVKITLTGSREDMMGGMDQYFTRDEENCPGGKVWAPEGRSGFYEQLLSGTAAPSAQRWYKVFDDIMYLLQINDFKGASAGYSRLLDERYFEENAQEKYIMDIAYPQFQSAYAGGLDDSINKIVYDDTIVPMIDDFKKEISSYGYEDENITYYLSVDYWIAAFDSNIISLCLDIYPYMGGAHGMLYFETINFDLEKNRVIGLEDLFGSGYDYAGAISEYCRGDLTEQMQKMGLEPDLEWIEEGTDPKNMDNFTSFLVTPRGLVMKFPAYQIAPYAAGDFSVVIPYGRLEGFIGP